LARDPYDTLRYPTWPRLETHPDRLAAVATLFGMNPAPVDRCRVLEIGAGDGGNLIPMAYALPRSRFTGVDLARAPVAEGRRAIRELGLTNVEMLRTDVRAIGRELGAFDYILAHGLYSWIPADARDALLAVCRDRLAPAGVALVSYNVYPGCYARRMLREMMLCHTGKRRSSRDAKGLLVWLREAAAPPAPWCALLAAEIDRMLERDDASFAHDDLAPVNHPVWFHEFADHAAGHGLQYVGEAHLHEMFDLRGALARLKGGRLPREQYLDFLQFRRFRQTLLCRREVRLAPRPLAGRVGRLSFSSPARPQGDFLEGVHGVRIRRRDRAVIRVAEQLAAAWPRPLPFAALRARTAGAREILMAFCLGGFAEPHAWHFPAPAAAGDRPEASAVARRQARTAPHVTNLLHRTVELDPVLVPLLPLLDGTRDLTALARDWAAAPGAPSRRAARASLPDVLAWMERMALLAG